MLDKCGTFFGVFLTPLVATGGPLIRSDETLERIKKFSVVTCTKAFFDFCDVWAVCHEIIHLLKALPHERKEPDNITA